MSNPKKELASALYALLKMDYSAELYSYSEWTPGKPFSGLVKISFYRLNSFHNAFCSGFAASNDVSINWQYASQNKRAAAYAEKALNACFCLSRVNQMDAAKVIFDHYRTAAKAVFDAKYTISQVLYTDNPD